MATERLDPHGIADGGVVPLAEANEGARFGEKAVQFGAAIRAGLPVPDGVALSADAVEAIAAADADTIASLEPILSSFGGPVAIRSSAIGDDSGGAALDGQQMSWLNVWTAAELADAVWRIWASARCGAALAQRRRAGIEGEPRIAAVVQPLVDADTSGVLFTRDPLTGADERVIEASWGLGQALAAGLVTPDRYRLSRRGKVLERTRGRKEVAIRPARAGGTRKERVQEKLAKRLCLANDRLAALHRLAESCERAFDGPRELEWAFANGDLHLLDSRRRLASNPWPPPQPRSSPPPLASSSSAVRTGS